MPTDEENIYVKTVVDLSPVDKRGRPAAPVVRIVPMTAEEIAERKQMTADFYAAEAAKQERAELLASLQPDEKLTAKLVDGVPLNEDERTQIARWQALKALG